MLDGDAEGQPTRVVTVGEQVAQRLEDVHGHVTGDDHEKDALRALEGQSEEGASRGCAQTLAGDDGDPGGALGLGPGDCLILEVFRGDGDDGDELHWAFLLWSRLRCSRSWMVA